MNDLSLVKSLKCFTFDLADSENAPDISNYVKAGRSQFSGVFLRFREISKKRNKLECDDLFLDYPGA